jgi:hypothetical protein
MASPSNFPSGKTPHAIFTRWHADPATPGRRLRELNPALPRRVGKASKPAL